MKDHGTKVLEDDSRVDIKAEDEEKRINCVEKEHPTVTKSKSDPAEANDDVLQLISDVKVLNINPDENKDNNDDDKDDNEKNNVLIGRGPTGGIAVHNPNINTYGNFLQSQGQYGQLLHNDNGRRVMDRDLQQDCPNPCPKFRRPAPEPQQVQPMFQTGRIGAYCFNDLNAPTGNIPFSNNLDFTNRVNEVISCNPVAGSGGKVIVQSPPPNGKSLADALLDEVNQQQTTNIPRPHDNQYQKDFTQFYPMTTPMSREENVLSPTPSVSSVNMRSPINNRRPSDPLSDSGVESAAESPYSDVVPSPTGSNYSCPPSVESGYGRSPQHEPGFSQTNYPVMSPNSNRFTPSPGSSVGYYSQQPNQTSFFDDPNMAQTLEDAYDIISRDLNDDQNKKLLTKQPVPPYSPNMAPCPAVNGVQPANFVPIPQLQKQQAPSPVTYQSVPQSNMPIQVVQSTTPIFIPPTVATTSSNKPSFIIVQPNPPAQSTAGQLIVVTQVPKTQPEKPRKPRKILPKVSSTTTTMTSSTNDSTKSICSTSSCNRSNIMAPREGPPGRNNQQATNAQDPHTRLLMLARRTVAGIKDDDLLKVDDEGDTILHIAVCKTDKYLVQALLERLDRWSLMSFADHENNKRQTPLYLAVYINQAVMVAMFIEFGVNVNALAQSFSSDGQTREVKAALHVAASQGHEYMDTLQQLLHAKDISINIVNNYGQTALHCAIAAHNKVKRNNEERINSIPVIKMLIKAGADVSAQDQKSGKTPLMYAIEQRDLLLVETILACIEPSKVRNVVRTQAFDGSSCLKIAEGLKDSYNGPAWNKLWNSLQSAASGSMRIQPQVF